MTQDSIRIARSNYKTRKFQFRELPGVWRYLDWLPPSNPLDSKVGAKTYRSVGLAKELGLEHLYIAFCGYFPERDAYNMTCSFKDLEAHVTIASLLEWGQDEVTVVSAGNTARAYAYAGTRYGYTVNLVVPERAREHLWLPCKPGSGVRTYITQDLKYADTIAKAPYFLDGVSEPLAGKENLARRDAIGTLILDAAEVIGSLPDCYFQAVGSGIGPLGCSGAGRQAYRTRVCERSDTSALSFPESSLRSNP